MCRKCEVTKQDPVFNYYRELQMENQPRESQNIIFNIREMRGIKIHVLILYLFTHPGICALPPLSVARSRRMGNNVFSKNSTVTFIALFVWN